MAEQIVVKNVAGVCQENVVIPLQPGGTTIWGYCGKGKSLLLEAIALGLDSRDRGRVEPGGYAKKGEAEICGVVVGINANRITRIGESDVASREEFSLSDLIDPPLKSDAAKNSHGIKALLRMSGGVADPALFYPIFGGKAEFDKIVDRDAIESADLVEMASKIKRVIDAKARAEISEADREEGKALADRNAGDGLNLEAASDPKALQDAHTAAVQYHARISEQARAYRDAVKARQQAEAALAASGDAYTGPTVKEANDRSELAKKTESQSREIAAVAEKALEAAKTQVLLDSREANAARDGLKAAEAHQKALADANHALAVAMPKEVTQDLVDIAADQVSEAQEAVGKGAVIVAAKRRIEQAKEHQKAAAEHRKEVMRLRDAGKATDDVLSQAVASKRFAVDSETLIGKLPDGTSGPYYRLSGGERTMIAVAEKIERVRQIDSTGQKLAFVLVEQEIAQELPPSVWEGLFRMAAKMNACIVRAMVDDGELRCEVWQGKDGD
jgi:hypothetical protein